MTRQLSIRLALLFAFALAVPAHSAPTDQLETTPKPPKYDEVWYQVMIQDQHCGYMKGVLRTVGDEVHSDTTIHIEINRGNQSVEMDMTQSSRESVDGQPLSFRNVQKLGKIEQSITGEIANGNVTIRQTQFGNTQESTHPFDPECRLAWGQTLAQMKHGIKPGTSIDLKTFEPSMSLEKPLETTIKFGEAETIDVLGTPLKLHKVTAVLNLGSANGAAGMLNQAEVESVSWINDDFTPIVTTVDLGIMKMKMYATTKEKALQKGAPPEMFLSTMITANHAVTPKARSAKFKLSIKPKHTGKLPTLPETEMQSFERIDERSGYVTVKRIDWSALDDKKISAKGVGEVYTQSSAVCDSDDRKVKRLAERNGSKDDEAAELANNLRLFATDYISAKGLDVGFATASEVAREKHGDCTEHSVFLAALARALGMPARGVGGLVGVPAGYTGSNAAMELGFHMWTQVYIDGKWIDIDAAMRQTDCDVTHIAICTMPLGNGGFVNEIGAILPVLGQVDVEVVEVDGKAVGMKAKE